MSIFLLRLLLKPINFLLNSTSLGLTFNIHSLRLVGLQLVRDVRFLGRLGWGRCVELLDMAFGISGLDGGDFVGLEFADVEVLDDVG